MPTITCNLSCSNGGYCSLYPHDATAMTSSPVDGSLHQICVCPLGFTGLTCLEPTEELDQCHHYHGTHLCRNGGFCRPVDVNEDLNFDQENRGEWRCDCTIADGVNGFAGAMCRQPATEYCDGNGSSFCTNGGTCVSNLVQYGFEG